MTVKWGRNGVFFPRAAHATSAAQQNASPSSSQDHQETGVRRFRNCTVSGDTGSGTKQTATTPPRYFPTTCYQTCYQYIPHACSQGDEMVTSPFLRVSRKWIPTCCHFGTLLRWISLDQQLSDFHFKGESLPFFPHYVQRIVYMILFYFRFFVCGLIMTSFVLMYQRHYIRSG